MPEIKVFVLLIVLLYSCKSEKSEGIGSKTIQKELTIEELGDLFSYYHSNPTNLKEQDENALIEYISDKGYPVVRTPNGFFIYKTQEGRGSLIQKGQALKAHYIGKFLDGKTFQSSYDAGRPLSFRQGQMVAGWNEALLQMYVGEKATLFIPSHLAYGENGIKNVIPANANLVFEVEIVE